MMFYDLSLLYFVSKVVVDYFVCVYYCIFGIDVVIINCLNNYGFYQFFEKFILLMILNVVEGWDLLIYGDGSNVCDWLYVEDYCCGILVVFECGQVGESYNFGGFSECNNVQVVDVVCVVFEIYCFVVDNVVFGGCIYMDFKIFVLDWFGYDQCYVIDLLKVQVEFDWNLSVIFEEGFLQMVGWYLDNVVWCCVV